jgi:predicted nucleotide-binding protein
VLFEIGWFYGRYGPRRLCILKKGKDTPLPSDLGGVLTLEFTTSVEEKYLRLQQELKAAGVIG